MDLSVITTYRCNSRCSMCYIWQNPTDPKEEIGLKELEPLPGGFDNLNITGGEPTLRKDLPQLVELLHPKCRKLEISSNGLHAERLEPIIRKYPDIKVRFSLEGFGERNDRIRGEKDGFEKKTAGLKRLKECGGQDLGFAMTIQDENADELVKLYQFAREQGFELATSALHNAFQFHKNDNHTYDRVAVARQVEGLIVQMLKSSSVKNWFRAYLNLGLVAQILGQKRLIPCTAATDFMFIDPWGDVFACNVRPDLLLGNLRKNSWEEILGSSKAGEIRGKVAQCRQNCWMVTTARTAMRSTWIPKAPKLGPAAWVVLNKMKATLGIPINFDRYVDYRNVGPSSGDVKRKSFLGKLVKRKLQREEDTHYVNIGDFFNG